MCILQELRHCQLLRRLVASASCFALSQPLFAPPALPEDYPFWCETLHVQRTQTEVDRLLNMFHLTVHVQCLADLEACAFPAVMAYPSAAMRFGLWNLTTRSQSNRPELLKVSVATSERCLDERSNSRTIPLIVVRMVTYANVGNVC